MTRHDVRRARAALTAGLALGGGLIGLDGTGSLASARAPVSDADRGCDEISWIGERGDWSDVVSWSGGAEPTIADCVSIADEDTVDVTMSGETCFALTLGNLTSASVTIWPASELDVLGLVRIGASGFGNIGQIGGTFTADRVELGTGGYALAGGSMNVASMLIGTAAVGGTLNTSGGSCTVSGDLELTSTGVAGINGGQLQVGGALIIGGRFGISGTGDVEAASLSMGSAGILAPFVSALGLIPIEVTTTATVMATLSITDFGAAEGTYDVIVAGAPITGTFDTVQLPSKEWTWGIDDNRLWIRKGDPAPVHDVSWSRVKNRYRDHRAP